MAEFREYKPDSFEDKKDNDGKKKFKLKGKLKSPWLWGGVLLVVILVIWRKLKSNNSSEEYIVPTGYSGYPEMTGGGTSYYDDALSTMADEMNTALDSIYKENETVTNSILKEWENQNKIYDLTIDEMSSQLDTFETKYQEVLNIVDTQSGMINYQNVISQMKNNSDMALLTKSQSEKSYLHTLNQQLGESIGATFNETDGYWYKDNQRLYSTSLQTLRTQVIVPGESSSSSSSSSTVSAYEQAISKMRLNSLNYKYADTTAKKDALYQENQELGKSIGLTFDASTGKWKKPDGTDAWNYSDGGYVASSSSSPSTSSSSGTVKSSSSSSSSSSNNNRGVVGGVTVTTSTTTKSSSTSSSNKSSSSSSNLTWHERQKLLNSAVKK